MEKLNHQDVQMLSSALTDLYADTNQTTLAHRTTQTVAKIIPNEIVSFDGFGTDNQYSFTAWNNDASILTPEVLESFVEVVHEHPLIPIIIGNKIQTAIKMTDYISQPALEKTGLYNEFFRRIGHKYQMGLALSITPEFTLSCAMNRAKTDFSERDRLVMSLIAPHLVNAIRNTFAFERLNSALETKECGVITVDGNGKIQFVSEFAAQLLQRYFANEKREDNSLPETLWNWIKQVSLSENALTPPLDFNSKNANGELKIRLMQSSTTREKTLLLEEKKNLSPQMFEKLNLTKRETEILFWMSQGKTDGDIAFICNISIFTVHKHAQNIYIKLGVETRTAAMLRALEIL